jgi:hypothetical protein
MVIHRYVMMFHGVIMIFDEAEGNISPLVPKGKNHIGLILKRARPLTLQQREIACVFRLVNGILGRR